MFTKRGVPNKCFFGKVRILVYLCLVLFATVLKRIKTCIYQLSDLFYTFVAFNLLSFSLYPVALFMFKADMSLFTRAYLNRFFSFKDFLYSEDIFADLIIWVYTIITPRTTYSNQQ